MFKSFKRSIVKMFREFLVYHNSSLEFRAKILTLMVSSNGEICECEKQTLKEIAHEIYSEDAERAQLLIDTVMEYHLKIVTDNGLNFEHLIQLVAKEVKEVKRFCKKIDTHVLMRLHACLDEEDEEAVLFQLRIIEFLESLKTECEVA
jgi:hypothetical protein